MQEAFFVGGASVFAGLAGVLHIAGYGSYLYSVLRRTIDLNPISWSMFAYGTTLIVVLEGAAGATWRELLLPGVCAAASTGVVIIGWRRGAMRWPNDRVELYSFAFDVALTVGYVVCWAISWVGALPPTQMEASVLAFLILGNAGVVTSFAPIMISTWRDPKREYWVPWAVWTTAYAALTYVTMIEEGTDGNLILYLYPLSNLLVHCALAIVSLDLRSLMKPLRERTEKLEPVGSLGTSEEALDYLYMADTAYTGIGLFTRRAFRKNDHVFNLTGTVHQYEIQTRDDACRYPNWYGLGKNLWLEPNHPFEFVNHSCEPNCLVQDRSCIALHDIRPGDELTIDYSVNEDCELWEMECHCRNPHCRRVVRPIQFLPHEVYERYRPYLSLYFRRVYEAAHGSQGASVS